MRRVPVLPQVQALPGAEIAPSVPHRHRDGVGGQHAEADLLGRGGAQRIVHARLMLLQRPGLRLALRAVDRDHVVAEQAVVVGGDLADGHGGVPALAEDLEEFVYSTGKPSGASQVKKWMEQQFAERIEEGRERYAIYGDPRRTEQRRGEVRGWILDCTGEDTEALAAYRERDGAIERVSDDAHVAEHGEVGEDRLAALELFELHQEAVAADIGVQREERLHPVELFGLPDRVGHGRHAQVGHRVLERRRAEAALRVGRRSRGEIAAGVGLETRIESCFGFPGIRSARSVAPGVVAPASRDPKGKCRGDYHGAHEPTGSRESSG